MKTQGNIHDKHETNDKHDKHDITDINADNLENWYYNLYCILTEQNCSGKKKFD